ncbi:hypothetical protein [Halanaerobium congolense]|uniref:hypothetical protein n=1 Tax=Halanaerobium congolense TaxID=54121 RepID=UPI001FB8FDC5|nr:hypothetical protein [Halanaerobium congolense]
MDYIVLKYHLRIVLALGSKYFWSKRRTLKKEKRLVKTLMNSGKKLSRDLGYIIKS